MTWRTIDTHRSSDHEILPPTCREALTGCAHQIEGPPTREAAPPRHEETTMAKYRLHDQYTPQKPAAGRS
jgi:hypothetical protein